MEKTKTGNLSLLEWYVQEINKTLSDKKQREKFIETLKNDPEIIKNFIKANVDSHIMSAMMSGELANPNVGIYDVDTHVQEVLEAFQKELL